MPELQTLPVEETSAKRAPWALDDLPPFPWVAKRLMVTLAQEDVDITEIGKLIDEGTKKVIATWLKAFEDWVAKKP